MIKLEEEVVVQEEVTAALCREGDGLSRPGKGRVPCCIVAMWMLGDMGRARAE